MGKWLHLCGKLKRPIKLLVIPGIVCDAVNFRFTSEVRSLKSQFGALQ